MFYKYKKEIILITLLFLCFLILPQTAQAAQAVTYYVDINGVGEDGILGTADDVVSSDGNPGTSESPWKTIARAQNYKTGYIPIGYDPMVQPGDTVIVRNGNYGTYNENNIYNPRDKWYITHRNDWITYKAETGHQPILATIQLRSEDAWNTPKVHGKSYLIFDGFKISTNVYLRQTSFVQVKNCYIEGPVLAYSGNYAPYYPTNSHAFTIDQEVNNVTIEGCEITNAFRGISVSGDNITIKNNTLHHFGEDAISGGGANNYLIEGNYIYDIDKRRARIDVRGDANGTFETGETVIQAGTGAEGIFNLKSGSTYEIFQTNTTYFTTGNYTITGQTSGATLSNISRAEYQHSDGIQIHTGTITDVTVRGNKIIVPGLQGLKFATYGDYLYNVLVENNLILAGTQITAYGLSDANFYNNTFYGAIAGGVDFHTGGYTPIYSIKNMYNNIFHSLRFQADVSVANHGNNIFGNNPNGQSGPSYPFSVNSTELVNYNIASLFMDAANGDFRLAPDSVAIDFGNPNYGPKTDILGNPRDSSPDAGAYEYISSTPPPPPPPPAILYGDVNGDVAVSSADALLTAQHSLGLTTLTSSQIQKGDVSGDRKVSAYDAALILQKVAGIISKFPKE